MATALTKNLTAQGTPAYSTTTVKFGTYALSGTGNSGGYSPTGSFLYGANETTLEVWFNGSVPTGTIQLLQVTDGAHPASISVLNTGIANGNFYDSTNTSRALSSTVNVCDGLWHHIAVCLNTSNLTIFIDGVLKATSSQAPGSYTSTNMSVGINTAHNGAWLQSGEYIDEAVIWGVVKYTANFTPLSSAYTGSEAYLYHLYHLENNLNDSNNPKVIFLTTAGTGTWATPSDWTGYNSIEAIGAGAHGNATQYAGGGGAYAQVLNQSLSGSNNYRVGTADGANGAGNVAANTWFNAITMVLAAGADPSSANTGAGGTTANSVGTTLFAGGAGYNSGAGAAGPNGAGVSAPTTAAPVAGGAGNNGAAGGGAAGSSAGGNGGNGTYWTSNPGGVQAGPGGGGGNDAAGHNGNGGNYGAGGANNYYGGTAGHGANGIIVITYVSAAAGTAYSLAETSASYAVSGHTIPLGLGLAESSASYALSGTTIPLGLGLAESSAAYAFTPSTATLTVNGAHPYNLVIATGAYQLSSHTLTPRLGIQCPVQSGSYAFTDSLLPAGFGLAETPAAYAVSRQVAGFVLGRVMPETSAVYGLNPSLIANSLTRVNTPASYSLNISNAIFNTSITKDTLIQTIPYFVDVPVIYLVNDLNMIINSVNQSVLHYAFSQSNLIKPFIMIPPDELNESLNLLVRSFNGVLDLLSWGQAYHLRYFSGVSAPELTLAVNTLIDEINGFTVSH